MLRRSGNEALLSCDNMAVRDGSTPAGPQALCGLGMLIRRIVHTRVLMQGTTDFVSVTATI